MLDSTIAQKSLLSYMVRKRFGFGFSLARAAAFVLRYPMHTPCTRLIRDSAPKFSLRRVAPTTFIATMTSIVTANRILQFMRITRKDIAALAGK